MTNLHCAGADTTYSLNDARQPIINPNKRQYIPTGCLRELINSPYVLVYGAYTVWGVYDSYMIINVIVD